MLLHIIVATFIHNTIFVLLCNILLSLQGAIMESLAVKDAKVSSREASENSWDMLAVETRIVQLQNIIVTAANTAVYRNV